MNSNTQHWLVSFNDLQPIYENQPVFFFTQCLLLFGGLCTLKHASSSGGKWLLLWFTITLNGVLLELIGTSMPWISLFWHSQGPVMLFGSKVPLGIVLFYPSIFYTSILIASLLKLPRLYESLAAGIIAEVINFPIDYVGLKYLQFTWHDSDPFMLERSNLIPWNAIFYHLLYVTVLCFLININEDAGKTVGDDATGRRKQYQESTNWRIFLLNTAAPIPLLFISFAILYHPWHDLLGIHTQIVFLSLFSLAIGLVWSACSPQNHKQSKHNIVGKTVPTYIPIFLFVYYSFFLLVPFLFEPEMVITTGRRQPIGPCNVTEPVHTVFGTVLERNKYICRSNRSFNYFDFHCVPEFFPAENEIVSEYTICGTPFHNKAEFVSILVTDAILTFCILKRVFYSVPDHRNCKNE